MSNKISGVTGPEVNEILADIEESSSMLTPQLITVDIFPYVL